MKLTIRNLPDGVGRALAMRSAAFCAQQFSIEWPDRPPGPRHGCAYTYSDGLCVVAYWTKARNLAVRIDKQARTAP